MILNGEEIATLLGPSYSLEVPQEKLKKQNTIEIRISNGMANRLEWMDKTNQNYKIFYNINMPAHDAENRGPDGLFTSKNWEPKPSGLLGQIKLIPLKIFNP
ncbi:MAG TPA: hypothetical protein VL125_05825 [Pelobium sp.]|nr:hypothetical protein [Pelobium sp.]